MSVATSGSVSAGKSKQNTCILYPKCHLLYSNFLLIELFYKSNITLAIFTYMRYCLITISLEHVSNSWPVKKKKNLQKNNIVTDHSSYSGVQKSDSTLKIREIFNILNIHYSSFSTVSWLLFKFRQICDIDSLFVNSFIQKISFFLRLVPST